MKTRILSTFILYLTFFSFINGQSIGLEIPDGKGRIDIPFTYENNFIILNVNFNFIFPLKFIFDTGAEHTILTQKKITDLTHTEYTRTFRVFGADLQEELIAHLVRSTHMRVEKTTAPHQDILVLEKDYFRFEEFTGTEVHGIIGADLFRRHVIKINFRKKVITLYNTASFHENVEKETRDYIEIPISIVKNKPYLNTNIYLQNGDTVKTKLLLDTGASMSLLLNTFTHPQLKMPENVIKGNIGTGLGGFLEGYKGRIRNLDIAEYSIPNIITNFQELSVLSDTTYLNGRNGIIGNEILERFTFMIDYQQQKLYIKANKSFDKEFKYDRSGITMIASGPFLQRYSIYSLVNPSPASEAGLKKDDVIKSVNYIPVRFLSLKNVSDLFHGKKGRRIRLVVKQDGERKVFKFKLRDLI